MILTIAQMKRAEMFADESGLSFLQMMENAGQAACRLIQRRFAGKCTGITAAILCGNGNNAGDGFVVARLLAELQADVTLILCDGQPRTKESAHNYDRISERPIRQLDLSLDLDQITLLLQKTDILVDAVFGTGFHGALSEPILALFALCNNIVAYKLALDIPSGINADTGQIAQTCFFATQTITFAVPKPAHTKRNLQEFFGKVIVADIGITDAILERAQQYPQTITAALVHEWLPTRRDNSHKGDYGKLLNISGSTGMVGAAMMSTLAALRCGAGITALAAPQDVISMIAPHLMEALTIPLKQNDTGELDIRAVKPLLEKAKTFSAVLIGCGLGTGTEQQILVGQLLQTLDQKIILDADGLNCLCENINILRGNPAQIVITPHPGEMARLTGRSIGDIENDRIQIAKSFAKDFGVIVVLKGSNTIVADPSGASFLNYTGNSGLAKGGSGDVLAGMIGGFAAMGLPLFQAAACAVFLHGKAADFCAQTMSKHSILARDILNALPFVLQEVER